MMHFLLAHIRSFAAPTEGSARHRTVSGGVLRKGELLLNAARFDTAIEES